MRLPIFSVAGEGEASVNNSLLVLLPMLNLLNFHLLLYLIIQHGKCYAYKWSVL